MADNRTVIEKAQLKLADLTTNGGVLPEGTAMKFIKSIVKEAELLPRCTVRPMNTPEHTEPSIKFGSRLLHAADEDTALPEAKRGKPITGKTNLVAKEFKAEVRLGNRVLEDNVEGSALQATVLELMSKQLATDMDEIMVLSDTASSDPDLALFDGLFKAATSNIVDAGGASFSKAILKNMMLTLGQEYRRKKKELTFLVADRCELDYRDSLAERATGAGDRYLAEDIPIMYSGSPVKSIPVFPENLGGGSNYANALYTPLKNIIAGIYKQITFETDKDISAGELIIVARLRWDVKYSEELAVVKATNILAA